jgi:hypothetical protein
MLQIEIIRSIESIRHNGPISHKNLDFIIDQCNDYIDDGYMELYVVRYKSTLNFKINYV